jgi:hypothetical protein
MRTNNHPRNGVLFTIAALVCVSLLQTCTLLAQARITYNGQQLFLSGSNIAWVNFAADVGPNAANVAAFRTIFDSVQANGGNAMRFWLHTNCVNTPQFDANGRVIGPGVNALSNVKAILDLAWQRKVGLILCLWSFDMLRISFGSLATNRAQLMLTDTSALRAYLDNALTPMITALKGHPGIIAWEVFNEPEGMSNEHGWDFTYHVPMAVIQRFTNRVAGAIHRIDPSAQVTTGAWSFISQSDMTPVSGTHGIPALLSSMTEYQKSQIESDFTARYGATMPADSILARFSVASNTNYYRDDRLIAAGGDPLGTLDFYTVHYYDWALTALSPFHHPYSTWNLTKPLVVAEFYLNTTFGVPYENIFPVLHATGYAGALNWQWYQNSVQQTRCRDAMHDLLLRFPEDVVINPVSGMIYAFTATPAITDRGETSTLAWSTSPGSIVSLDGMTVPVRGEYPVTPQTTTTYTLLASGTMLNTATATVAVYPSGRILSFYARPAAIGKGDTSWLFWRSTAGSQALLDLQPVRERDSMAVYPDSTTIYRLTAAGAVRDSQVVTLRVAAPEQINRALYRTILASSSDSDTLVGDPQHLVDGDLTTQWSSSTVNSQWILCDLGKSYRIKRVVFAWGTNHATMYRLGISSDSVSYILLRSSLAGTGSTETLDSLNAVGRYLKLMLDRKNLAGGYLMKEFEVYGLPETPSSAQTPLDELPDQPRLMQNFPNPFNPTTVVRYQVPAPGGIQGQVAGSQVPVITLRVYDLLGREVALLVNERKPAGGYEVKFDASGLATGVYLYRLTAGAFVQTRTMLLLR